MAEIKMKTTAENAKPDEGDEQATQPEPASEAESAAPAPSAASIPLRRQTE